MQACWARDGEHLAVLRFLQDGRANWWYVALDGSSAEELISPRQSLTGMFPCAFSPDGRRLVFAQLEGRYSQLFLLDMESRKEQQLTFSLSHKDRCGVVARWPLDRVFVECQSRQHWTAGLEDSERRRPGRALDVHIRAPPPPVLLAGWSLALRAAQPSKHLPSAGPWRTVAAGDTLPGIRAVPGGTHALP